MRDPEDTTRRMITMPEHEITTHVEYSYTEGRYVVVLNPDADRLPSRVKLYLPRETSQALVRDLAAQQAEADKRNHAEDPEWHPAPAETAEAVRAFLDQELQRDDMTLAEIAAEAVKIATGAATFEPDEDDEDEPRRVPASQLGAGCPQCGTDLWGYDTTSAETEGLGPASCERGHAWIVTEG